jgi:parvulin-like peptidyl-prolyl isomerase
MGKRKMYNTTLDVDLLREFKILAAKLDLRQNDLMEEAIQDLIKKYEQKESLMNVSKGRTNHNRTSF